ncbi:MAG TPA: cation:proton antiporter [Terriglobia bacterium]|nr:cation:proton antiporter [Terriglobia bacterium]
MNIWLTASLWVGLALVAAMISIRVGISVALVEIGVGVLAGNFLHLTPNDWVNFLAGVGSVLLTFLAGAEIDPAALRANLKESLVIGFFSFLAPALGAFAVAFWIFKWNLHGAEIAGIALSTTSVAVVYAVMIESGLNETELGKAILASCFVTDLGTVVALGLLFANYNRWLLIFVVVTAVVLWKLRSFTAWYFRKVGNRVSEPEVKFILLLLFLLGGQAAAARSEAVLPAYLIGLVMAHQFLQNRVLMHRMRAIAFSLLTPFYFIKAGSYVSFKALVAGLGLIAAFFLMKMITKVCGVLPFALTFGFGRRRGMYTTLLMATGLTFGSISALFGLTHGYINQSQYTILVTVVILSAVVPTLIAERFFSPDLESEAAKGRQAEVSSAAAMESEA